jgi:hypothetical protein
MVQNRHEILSLLLSRYFEQLRDQTLRLSSTADVVFLLRRTEPTEYLDWDSIVEHFRCHDGIFVPMSIVTPSRAQFLLMVKFEWKPGQQMLQKAYQATTPIGDITPYDMISNYVIMLAESKDDPCFRIDAEPHHPLVKATFPHHLHEYRASGNRRKPRGVISYDGAFSSLIGLLELFLY